MILNELITGVNSLKPSVYTGDHIATWLSELDGKLASELRLSPIPSYTLPEDGDASLLAPHPYDAFYIPYVMSKIDFFNREFEEYNNDKAVAQAAIDDFKAWHRRTHIPPATNLITM